MHVAIITLPTITDNGKIATHIDMYDCVILE